MGDSIHWSQKPTRSLDASPWSQPEAVDVELTVYVLLAWLTKAGLTQKEIAKATGIVAGWPSNAMCMGASLPLR